MSGELTEAKKGRVLHGLRDRVRRAILGGTPKYRMVLALREEGLKLETARAFVELVESSAETHRAALARGIELDRQKDSPRRSENDAEMIRRLEALIRANFQE